jgi:hypothetical protein
MIDKNKLYFVTERLGNYIMTEFNGGMEVLKSKNNIICKLFGHNFDPFYNKRNFIYGYCKRCNKAIKYTISGDGRIND